MVKFCKSYNVNVSQVLGKRTHLRHRFNHETDRDKLCIRRAYYDPDYKCIVRVDSTDPTKGYRYSTPSSFCKEHYAMRRGDRVSNCNGWKEMEAFVDGRWVSLTALRDRALQPMTSKASNTA